MEILHSVKADWLFDLQSVNKEHSFKTQGIAYDEIDNVYIFSGGMNSMGLEKVKFDTCESVFSIEDKDVLPKVFNGFNCDHLGSIDINNNKIYAPFEDSFSFKHPAIVEYNKDFSINNYGFLDITYLPKGVPWCSVHDGILYTSEYHTPTQVVGYEISKLLDNTLIKKIPNVIIPILNNAYLPTYIQCGKVYENFLYIIDDSHHFFKKIFKICILSGKIFHHLSFVVVNNQEHYMTSVESFCICNTSTGVVFTILVKKINTLKPSKTYSYSGLIKLDVLR